ncbi:MAG: glycosyltransferase family 2 protein [Planctomycetales bacterium]|nr:glycosyltransferase family 2 protein [Planctomycetales bacterium]
MEQSLSIIIAAHNAQQTIERQVQDLLEVATDLTGQIEVLVVDDGSEDDTEEVTYELTRRYPQVQLVRHETQRGTTAAIRTGMNRTHGEIVLVQDSTAPVKASDVRRLWAMGKEEDILMVRPEPIEETTDSTVLKRLIAWGAKVAQTNKHQQAGLQMIRRQAADASRDQLDYELERVERPAASVCTVRSPRFLSQDNASTAETSSSHS